MADPKIINSPLSGSFTERNQRNSRDNPKAAQYIAPYVPPPDQERDLRSSTKREPDSNPLHRHCLRPHVQIPALH